MEAMESASPQTDNGFCKLANELMEAIIRFPFSKRQYALILAIIRQTYGYNKKTDHISVWRLADMCAMGRQHASAALKELAEMQVITYQNSIQYSHGQALKIVGLNKDYTKWRTVPKTETVTKTGTVPETGVAPYPKQDTTVPETGHTKDKQNTYTKDNKKDARKTGRPNIEIKTFLKECHEQGVPEIPADDPILRYAEETGIPEYFIAICWMEFVERHLENRKKQKDWRAAFRNCVRSIWYQLWFFDYETGECRLTTKGIQAEKKHKGKLNAA